MFGVSSFAAAPFASQAGATYSETVSESISANASTLSIGTFNVFLNETADANDAIGSTAIYNVSLSQLIIGFSPQNSAASRVGFVQEAGEMATGPAAATAIPVIFVSAVNANDAPLGLLSVDGAVAETSTGTSVTAGDREIPGAIAETGTGSDVLAADYIFVGTASEIASATDVTIGLGDLIGVIAEGAEGAVVTIGNTTYLITVSEIVTGSDITLRRLQWEIIDTSDGSNWQTVPTLN